MTTPAIWRRMFADIPSAHFGLNYDPSHFVLQFMDPASALHEFQDKLFHLHAKDVKIYRERLNEVGIFAHPLEWHQPRIPGLRRNRLGALHVGAAWRPATTARCASRSRTTPSARRSKAGSARCERPAIFSRPSFHGRHDGESIHFVPAGRALPGWRSPAPRGHPRPAARFPGRWSRPRRSGHGGRRPGRCHRPGRARGLPGLGPHAGEGPRAAALSIQGAGRKKYPAAGGDGCARKRQDRRRSRGRHSARARSRRIRLLAAGAHRRRFPRSEPRAWTATRAAFRSAWSRASRRSIFPRWCRCGCFRWPSPAATLSS